MGIKLQKQSFLLVHRKNSEMKSGKKNSIYNSNQGDKIFKIKNDKKGKVPCGA